MHLARRRMTRDTTRSRRVTKAARSARVRPAVGCALERARRTSRHGFDEEHATTDGIEVRTDVHLGTEVGPRLDEHRTAVGPVIRGDREHGPGLLADRK